MGEPPLVSSSHWVRIWESPACGWDMGKQSKLQNDSRAVQLMGLLLFQWEKCCCEEDLGLELWHSSSAGYLLPW